jgi:hypothetical protein
MKRLLLTGLLLLTVATLGSTAHAQRFEFDYTSSLVTFTVPINGIYQIVAFGAQGGDGHGGSASGGSETAAGGRGADVGGNFNLTAREVLQIAVGGMGASEFLFAGGGGGGSFVVGPGNAPLVVAGGGGAAGAEPTLSGSSPARAGSRRPATATVVLAGAAAPAAAAAADFSAPAVRLPASPVGAAAPGRASREAAAARRAASAAAAARRAGAAAAATAEAAEGVPVP